MMMIIIIIIIIIIVLNVPNNTHKSTVLSTSPTGGFFPSSTLEEKPFTLE
jgi:competence protein ComGC